MNVSELISALDAEFFAGVPDSKLRPLVDYLMDTYGANGPVHMIAANEGSAAALAAGYHLATGKMPLIYLQNSGLGNTINPLLSLLHKEVYAIPCIFVIGWRGEPDLHDEPQHLVQGRLSLPLLETMGVKTMVLTRDATSAEVVSWMKQIRPHLEEGGQCALLVRDGVLDYPKRKYANAHPLRREDAIARILDAAGDAVIVATTGKTGRELFELREQRGEDHAHDFLTVGSMGHAGAIALGIALHRPQQRVIILDGDGAALMHMGASVPLHRRISSTSSSTTRHTRASAAHRRRQSPSTSPPSPKTSAIMCCRRRRQRMNSRTPLRSCTTRMPSPSSKSAPPSAPVRISAARRRRRRRIKRH